MPDPGIGFLPLSGRSPYDEDYFAKYEGYAHTSVGRALNDARLAMLRKHWPSSPGDRATVVDIGIGSGTFVEAAGCCGFDVNPAGLRWLFNAGRYRDPYQDGADVITCWDSLEHIEDPAPLLAKVRHLVLVAIPIFRDLAHVLGSKHLRPDEHCYYFTEPGLEWFMAQHGFRLTDANECESRLGREDIRSYAFRRAA